MKGRAWYARFGAALDLLRSKGSAYRRIPDEVLFDLAKFCRAHETCYNADPRIHAVLEGRREVWLRIQKFSRLSPERLLEIYVQGQAPTMEDET